MSPVGHTHCVFVSESFVQLVTRFSQVVTSTVLSTQSVVVAEAKKASSPTRSLRQLQLLQAILGLRRS